MGFDDFQKFLKAISWESTITECKGRQQKSQPEVNYSPDAESLEYTCFVDGSWEKGWEGGIGFCIFFRGELVLYRSAKTEGCCPIQSEARVLKNAIKLVRERGIVNCCFFSDCKQLVQDVSTASPPINSDWRAFEEILSIWEVLREEHAFSCVYNARELNQTADGLSKLGRTQGWDVTGYTFPMFNRL